MSCYPAWICSDCGKRLGRRQPRQATWHDDTCGWCGEVRACTEPRDYGYPASPGAIAAIGSPPPSSGGAANRASLTVSGPACPDVHLSPEETARA